MQTIPFHLEYLDRAVELFISEFSEPGHEWDDQTTKEYLKQSYEKFPELCFVTKDNETFAGVIFARIEPYYTSKILYFDIVIVAPEYRNKGVGKLLMQEVTNVSLNKGITLAHMLVDRRIDFPINWYKDKGFHETGYVELTGKLTEDTFK